MWATQLFSYSDFLCLDSVGGKNRTKTKPTKPQNNKLPKMVLRCALIFIWMIFVVLTEFLTICVL